MTSLRALLPLLALAVVLLSTPSPAQVSAAVLKQLEAQKPGSRLKAVNTVAASGDPIARRVLEGMLGDDDERVRAAAADGLGRIGDPRSLPKLKALSGDSSLAVKRAARLASATIESRASAASTKRPSAASTTTAAPTVVVDIPKAEDHSGQADGQVLRLLRTLVRESLEGDRRMRVAVTPQAKEGYGLWLRIRSVEDGKQGAVSLVTVKCEMTLVALPQNALRLSTSAAAGVGVEGSISPELKKELVVDGVKACAPELAKDFIDYARTRVR